MKTRRPLSCALTFVSALNPFLFTSTTSAEDEVIPELDELVVVGEQTSYFEKARGTALKLDVDDSLVPYSTNVINETMLEDLKARTLEDAYPYIPGFTRSGNNANSFTIRGHSADLQNIQVDGLPGLTSRFGSPVTANIERVEVLKGPASLLYGWMDPGGLVNIITKKPEFEKSHTLDMATQYFTGQGEFGFGSNIDLTGPLNDDRTILYRLIAGGEQEDSFRNFVDERSAYVFPSISWVPDEETRLDLQFEYLREDRSADSGLFVLNRDINTVAPIETYYQEPGDTDDDEGYAFNLNFDRDISDALELNVKWRSVWHEDERDLYENNAVRPDNTLRRRNRHQYNEREYHFADINLEYSTETRGVENRLLAGINGGYEYRQFDRLAFDTRGANVNLLNPVYTGPVLADDPGNFRNWDLYNYGAYISDHITFNKRYSFVFGVRHDRQKGDYHESFRDNATVVDADASVNSTIFNTGLVYAPTETLSVYGGYSQSFSPQAIPSFDTNGLELAPEEGEQYEVGVKLALLEETLNLNFAYFDITKSNVKETNPATGDPELVGDIASNGIEFVMQYLPTPTVQMQLGYTYMNAEVEESFNANAIGNEPAFAPEHNLSFWLRYNHPREVLGGLVGASLGYKYESMRFTDEESNRRVELPGYNVIDLGLYYELEDVKFALNFANALDDEYFVGGSNDVRLYPGEPRKVTLSASYEF